MNNSGFDIKALRTELRFSQSELARRADVDRIRLCRHELGDLELTLDEVGRIRTALIDEATRIRSITELFSEAISGSEARR